jgi:hypothetical protein
MSISASVALPLVACKELGNAFSLTRSRPVAAIRRMRSEDLDSSEGMSDFGSRMGAARLGKAASDAVIAATRRSLTWADTIT